MRLKKILVLGFCSFMLLSQFIFAAGQKKDNYVEMSIEEFNSMDLYELYKKKKITLNDFYSGGVRLHRGDKEIKFDYSNLKDEKLYERIEHYSWEKDIVTCKVKGKMKSDDNYGKQYSFIVENIENLRSIEDVENARQTMLARIEKIKENAAKKIESIINESDRIGSEIAKGYIYHGYNDNSRNKKLFLNNALEKGNAYYIPSFKLDGIYAIYKNQDIFAGKEVQFVYVNFANQKLKAEYVDLDNKTDVIVTADNIVIGNIGYITSSKIYDFRNTENWIIRSNFDSDGLSYKKICEVEKELGIEQE
ncbi:hypothetical protein MSI_07870 [Treponema sp. JC4]|uniref:hypothetical protein n=1 Tax=Treponema sp. JC4 TaxID=1124982 RepID=UPI00025B0A37|nr:hypothetical protein [Treponema sp. JC4]EID86434.1 hypothetical protein MSI_07870 [Treponema sp. JC4]